jgi:hypothetical protein
VTNDVSPYLQRPVRTLEEVMAEAAQQRPETPTVATVAAHQLPGQSNLADTPAALPPR